jgi:hypothetical protein
VKAVFDDRPRSAVAGACEPGSLLVEEQQVGMNLPMYRDSGIARDRDVEVEDVDDISGSCGKLPRWTVADGSATPGARSSACAARIAM